MKKHLPSFILYFLLLLCVPFAAGRLFQPALPFAGTIIGLDFSGLGYVGFAFALWRLPMFSKHKNGKLLLFLCETGVVILLFQCFYFHLTFDQFSTGLAPFGLVAAGFAWRVELRKYLPLALALLGLTGLGIVLQEFAHSLNPYGLCGNWNWSWTLLLICSSFTALPLSKILRPCWGVPLLTAGTALLSLRAPCYFPRGTWFCAGAAILLLLIFQTPRNIRKMLLWGMVLIGIVLFGAGLYKISRPAAQEVRFHLYKASCNMLLEQPLLGIGSGTFNSEIMPYLREKYFRSGFGTDLHPHPHNELLAFWAAYGFFGVLFFLYCVFQGFFRLFRHPPHTWTGIVFSFGWLVLLFHGQLDVLLSIPLTGTLFFLFTGMILALPGKMSFPFSWNFHKIGAGLLLGFAALLTIRNLYTSFLDREAALDWAQHDFPATEENFLKSAKFRNRPETWYALARLAFFDFKDPAKTLQYLDRLNATNMHYFGHSAGFRARALAVSGHPQESFKWFEQEQQLFPLSAINAYFHAQMLARYGNSAAAAREWERYLTLMQQKGMNPQEIRVLLRRQDFDDHNFNIK